MLKGGTFTDSGSHKVKGQFRFRCKDFENRRCQGTAQHPRSKWKPHLSNITVLGTWSYPRYNEGYTEFCYPVYKTSITNNLILSLTRRDEHVDFDGDGRLLSDTVWVPLFLSFSISFSLPRRGRTAVTMPLSLLSSQGATLHPVRSYIHFPQPGSPILTSLHTEF